MTRARIRVLLDENVPVEVKEWLQERKSLWEVSHVYDVGLESRPDSEVFAWAQANGCLIITFDTDFANSQDFPVGRHYGVIRLRLKYTTEEEAMKALEPIFDRVDQRTLRDRVIIFKNGRIRVRPGLPPEEQA